MKHTYPFRQITTHYRARILVPDSAPDLELGRRYYGAALYEGATYRYYDDCAQRTVEISATELEAVGARVRREQL